MNRPTETIKYSALVLDPSDNVATVLADVECRAEIALQGMDGNIRAASFIAFGHKIAVTYIAAGSDIHKYGQKIGIATADILPGEWVHLHNMRSAIDMTFRERIGR